MTTTCYFKRKRNNIDTNQSTFAAVSTACGFQNLSFWLPKQALSHRETYCFTIRNNRFWKASRKELIMRKINNQIIS